MDSRRACLEFRRVAFSYGERTVLSQFSLTLYRSEILALLGPSGCGKSTVLNLAAGFLSPQRGCVITPAGENPGPGVDRAIVTQEDGVFPWLTVEENVAFGSRARGGSSDVNKWLRYVGMQHERSTYPRELSGGMLQRVALARAWANEPDVLLLDEPLRSLDWGVKIELLEIIRSAAAPLGQAVLLVTHDPDEAVCVADRVVVLGRSGEIIWEDRNPSAVGSIIARRRRADFHQFRDELERQVLRAFELSRSGFFKAQENAVEI